MICVTSEVLSARSVDRPMAVDLVEIAIASGLKFIGLLGRKLAAFIFDNESSLLDRRCRKKTQARAGTADTESSFAGHIRQPHRGGSAIDLSAIASWCACLVGPSIARPWVESSHIYSGSTPARNFEIGSRLFRTFGLAERRPALAHAVMAPSPCQAPIGPIFAAAYSWSRNWLRRIFPVGVFGRLAMNSTRRGYL